MGGDPSLEPGLYGFAQLALQKIVGDKLDSRRQFVRAGRELGDDRAGPPQLRMFAQMDGVVGRGRKSASTRRDLAFEALERGGAQGAAVNAFRSRIGREAKAVELADMLGAERHRAGIVEDQRQ